MGFSFCGWSFGILRLAFPGFQFYWLCCWLARCACCTLDGVQAYGAAMDLLSAYARRLPSPSAPLRNPPTWRALLAAPRPGLVPRARRPGPFPLSRIFNPTCGPCKVVHPGAPLSIRSRALRYGGTLLSFRFPRLRGGLVDMRCARSELLSSSALSFAASSTGRSLARVHLRVFRPLMLCLLRLFRSLSSRSCARGEPPRGPRDAYTFSSFV